MEKGHDTSNRNFRKEENMQREKEKSLTFKGKTVITNITRKCVFGLRKPKTPLQEK